MEQLLPQHKEIAKRIFDLLMEEPTTGYTEKLLIVTLVKQGIIERMEAESQEALKKVDILRGLIEKHR